MPASRAERQRYHAFGLELTSDLRLPELEPCLDPGASRPETSAAVELLLESQPAGLRQPSRWLHHWRDDAGASWLSAARTETGYLLRFPGLADFELSADATQVRYQAAPGVPPATLRHLFLDQVLPRLLGHRGELVLHAAAVARGGQAVAFAGKSGCGKSTLAASLAAEGFDLLADDAAWIEARANSVWTRPSYPGVRLWPDVGRVVVRHPGGQQAMAGRVPQETSVAHYTQKRRFRSPGRFGPGADSSPVVLRRIYLLAAESPSEVATGVTVEPLPAREAMLEMVRNHFCLDVDDPERNARAFRAIGEVVRTVGLHRLHFPRTLEALPAVRAAICRRLAGEPSLLS